MTTTPPNPGAEPTSVPPEPPAPPVPYRPAGPASGAAPAAPVAYGQGPADGRCVACGEPLTGAAFCEACGARVHTVPLPSAEPASDLDELGPISAPTNVLTGGPMPVDLGPAPTTCTECGGAVGADLYCQTCGTKATSPRDHFRAAPAPWVAGVCDRGVRHTRNEDAMALAADPTPTGRAALVVCDGVSSATDSDVASLAAAAAALEVLRAPLPKGLGVPASREAAVVQVFGRAAEAGNAAVVAVTPPGVANPASCTFVAAVVEDGTVWHAGIGDSRAYLLPDDGPALQLTVDDSMAQVLMAGGMDRAEAERSPQAHAITKWLGADTPDVVPRVGSVPVTAPGWLMLCSDGLWNYASEPDALRERLRATGEHEPGAIAAALVDWANAQGGQDNITVVLARVGGDTPAAHGSVGADGAVGQNATTPDHEAGHEAGHGPGDERESHG